MPALAVRASLSRPAATGKADPTTAPRHVAFLAAAALLLAAPSADAKVILAKSNPKKVFQGEASTPRERSAPAEKAAKKAGGGFAFVTPSIGPPTGVLALPGAILGIAGVAALATTVDSKFVDFIDKATLRDCNNFAGYEPALKGEGGVAPRAAPAKAKKSLFKKK